MGRKGLLERLEEGVVIGDGGFLIALEKRGYVSAGPWTPEASVKHPDAVYQLHREFLRAGSDVVQTFSFYSSDDKLSVKNKNSTEQISCIELNSAACKIAKRAAADSGALIAGSVSQNCAYKDGKGKDYIQSEIRKQVGAFIQHGIDFIICEFFESIEEIEWAIEEVRKSGLPVMATMCIGKTGDEKDVPIGECGIRMARAKADVVGLNCMFGPLMSLEAMKLMKEALDNAGLQPYLAMQPNGFFTRNTSKLGYLELPEFPYAMEPRTITRIDARKYAKKAYQIGVRYIGGCCGFEAHHIRAMSEALSKHRGGKMPAGSENCMPEAESLKQSSYPMIRARASQSYWDNLVPDSGRLETPTYPCHK